MSSEGGIQKTKAKEHGENVILNLVGAWYACCGLCVFGEQFASLFIHLSI